MRRLGVAILNVPAPALAGWLIRRRPRRESEKLAWPICAPPYIEAHRRSAWHVAGSPADGWLIFHNRWNDVILLRMRKSPRSCRANTPRRPDDGDVRETSPPSRRRDVGEAKYFTDIDCRHGPWLAGAEIAARGIARRAPPGHGPRRARPPARHGPIARLSPRQRGGREGKQMAARNGAQASPASA